jgi:hypothetical protein
MQLRSGKTAANMSRPVKNVMKVPVLVQDQGDAYYKSFQSISGILLSDFGKLNAMKSTSLDRVSIIIKIFKLVQTKITELRYLKDDARYASIKKLYLAIKDKIPELISSLSNIMEHTHALDDESIEEITSCIALLAKLRKEFK